MTSHNCGAAFRVRVNHFPPTPSRNQLPEGNAKALDVDKSQNLGRFFEPDWATDSQSMRTFMLLVSYRIFFTRGRRALPYRMARRPLPNGTRLPPLETAELAHLSP
ncbi:hypothetical protein [Consotaella salsifontis]|uniref:hypothetical protein n=1 Tax=Consotaella salsifontis TaxID=1365950 RepID=UPI0010547C16|nr:hypothetical protein [Consotaella salsifontis]